MNLKEELIRSIKGLKMQSEIALASQGDNKQINDAQLKEAQSLIGSDVLESKILIEYMEIFKLKSLIEIDEAELWKWIEKEFDGDCSELANIVFVNEDNKIHLGSSLQKLKEDGKKLDYIETSNFSLCDKAVKGYGASNLVVNVNTPELMKSFFEEVKEDFGNVCEECMNNAFGEYWKESQKN